MKPIRRRAGSASLFPQVTALGKYAPSPGRILEGLLREEASGGTVPAVLEGVTHE